MKTLTVLFAAALMLVVVAGASAADLGSGVIIGVSKTGDSNFDTYAVQFGDTVRFAYLTPNEDQEYCGTTFKAGGKYPIFLVDSAETDGVEATIFWKAAAGTDLSAFPYGSPLEIGGLAPRPQYSNTVQTCDTVTLQWQGNSGGGKWVTVNMFRDRQSAGLFSFATE